LAVTGKKVGYACGEVGGEGEEDIFLTIISFKIIRETKNWKLQLLTWWNRVEGAVYIYQAISSFSLLAFLTLIPIV
jgi:hypothetical protein